MNNMTKPYFRNSENGWGLIARLLHWIVAFMIFGLLASGFIMTDLSFETQGPQKMEMYGIHKSIGATLLILMIVRLVWRFLNKPPRPEPNLKPWERHLSAIVHALLYVALFALPVSGWVMSASAGHPVSWFGLFTFPDLIGKNEGLHAIAEEIHETSPFFLAGLFVLHISGALKHWILDKDRTLQRMIRHTPT